MADHSPSVEDSARVWGDHVAAAIGRQIDHGLHVRSSLASGYDLGTWTTDVTSYAKATLTDAAKSVGLLASLAKSMASEGAQRRDPQ